MRRIPHRQRRRAFRRAERVRITTGNAALGPDDGEIDVVVMDDFLYAEPVPEPAVVTLIGLGLLGLGAARRGTPRSGRA